VAASAAPQLTFRTPPLKAPLALAGSIYADLWVTVDKPVAYIQADLDILNDVGSVVSYRPGVRSVSYLAPLVGSRFVQKAPVAPKVGVPLRVVLRFDPVDVVVPEGGTIVLTFAGITRAEIPPSTGGATITLHHDCTRPSTLRFLMPRARADWLDVPGTELSGESLEPDGRLRDGGGLAAAPVCGRRAPRDVSLQGRATS
jgi:hypothetical protein